MKGRSLSGFQQKRVWVSDGAGGFRAGVVAAKA